jgi:tetratricopeptide (TPR) repeat protein
MRAFLMIVALLAYSSASALADDRETAREAFRRGSQHYKLGEYKEALADFKLAFRSYEDPSFLYNIAQCERQLGMREDAVREYRMYLAESSDASNRDDVRALIVRLEREIADAHAHAAPPPTLTPSTTPSATRTDVTLVGAPPHGNLARPAYKKWWVWTIVGVVAAGSAAGLAVGLTRNGAAPAANTTLGTAHPSFN